MGGKVSFSVFTKPWKDITISELAGFVKSQGFDAIEFPLRPGYQVEPENAEKGLPELARVMNEYGLKIASISSSLDENVFAGCQAAGIPIIRIMARIDAKNGYMASEAANKKELERVMPLCRKYGVKVGIQNHFGKNVSNAMGLLHLMENMDPQCIGAVWDAAHASLCGEEPELGLDIVWSHLCMVNLKNAFYRRVNGPEAEKAEWANYFTTGRQGQASWPRVAEYLKTRNYEGVICLTAQYDDSLNTNRFISEDISYVKSLFK